MNLDPAVQLGPDEGTFGTTTCRGLRPETVIPAQERVKQLKSQAPANLLCRHSRESGNPFLALEQAGTWVPAFAGTTLRPGCRRLNWLQTPDLA
jgi:hypothetical protein